MQHSTTYSIITGSGRYIPAKLVKNSDFLGHTFFNEKGELIQKQNEDIIKTLHKITDIEKRYYVEDDMVASDLGYLAGKEAIDSAELDKEQLDYIIVAHNFGDVLKDNRRSDLVPTLAARIKYRLGIQNPFTIAYDLPFGCPGWIQAMIQANYYIQSGDAKKILVIGTETLSRISDPHDIDSMIFSDGAGAVVLEAKTSDKPIGVLKHISRSDTLQHAHLLNMEESYNPDYKDNTLFLKMNGRKLYEYAISTVPNCLKECIQKAGLELADIKKLLIHQANAKMDYNILARLFELYGIKNPDIPENIMPMTISKLGNNSVATIPILYDYIHKKELEPHEFLPGDHLLFASVGAGMNLNTFVYKVP